MKRRRIIIILLVLSVVIVCPCPDLNYAPSEADASTKSIEIPLREIDDTNIEEADWSAQQKSYLNHSPINITSDADFAVQKIAEGWAGNGTQTNPYVIEGYNITNNGNAIGVSNVSSYFMIRDCLLLSPGTPPPIGGYDDGIAVINSSHGFIANNIIRDATSAGIFVGWSNCAVFSNEFHNNSLGIAFYYSSGSAHHNEIIDSWGDNIQVLYSEGCDVSYNTLVEGESVSISNSNRCRIEHNTVHQVGPIYLINSTECSVGNNEIAGVGSDAIVLYEVRQSVVLHNVINEAEYRGIAVQNTVECNFTGNRIESCSNGFFIEDCNSSIFSYNYIAYNRVTGITLVSGHHNRFYGNLLAGMRLEAIDDGFDNRWYNENEYGNYWGSFNRVEPFRIDGSAGSRDRYPLSSTDTDITLPLVMSRCDYYIHWIYGTRFAKITWVTWGYTNTYVLFRNEELFETGPWPGFGAYHTDVNIPTGRIYNYTFTVADEAETHASSTILLPPPLEISSPPDIMKVQDDSWVQIEWDAWSLLAMYYVLKDDVVIEAGDHAGNQPILCWLDDLGSGSFNLTAVLSDDNGQIVADTVIVVVLIRPAWVQFVMNSAVISLVIVVIVVEIRSQRPTASRAAKRSELL